MLAVTALLGCGHRTSPPAQTAPQVRDPAEATAPGGDPDTGSRPMNSQELQARAQAESERFDRAVKEEADPRRLPVEAVAYEVLVDRDHNLVYLLTPDLLAVDLSTGAERWRAANTKGVMLGRLGKSLVVHQGNPGLRPHIVLVDPAAPNAARSCQLTVPAPPQAEFVQIQPFDRAGRTYLWWNSGATLRQGGPPTRDEERKRHEAAIGCGVMTFDANNCALGPARLQDFLLSPPRDRGSLVEIAPDNCRYLAPAREMPAVAASLPPHAALDKGSPLLRTVTTPVSPADGGCRQTLKVSVEAVDSEGTILWTYPLADHLSTDGCPGPP